MERDPLVSLDHEVMSAFLALRGRGGHQVKMEHQAPKEPLVLEEIQVLLDLLVSLDLLDSQDLLDREETLVQEVVPVHLVLKALRVLEEILVFQDQPVRPDHRERQALKAQLVELEHQVSCNVEQSQRNYWCQQVNARLHLKWQWTEFLIGPQ